MIRLIKANEKDLALIHRMQHEAFADLLKTYQDFETNPGAEPVSRIAERMAQKATQYYLIYKHDKVIGACRVHTSDQVHRISPIFILPSFQGMGYAKIALYQLEALHQSHQKWQLSTIKNETRLCKFYETCGYVKTGEHEIHSGMTLVYYEKTIEPVSESHLSDVIEKMQTDHEKSQAVGKIQVALDQDYCMINNLESKSIYSTRVVYGHEGHLTKEALYEKAQDFFGGKPYSWWVTLPRDQAIYDLITQKGFETLDHYHGRYKALDKDYPVSHAIVDIQGHDHQAIRDLAMTTFDVWETDPAQVDFAINRYQAYLSAEDRRGGYLLVYVGHEPAGYASYRFSNCQRFLYLSGTGVRNQFRHMGIYTSLLNHRLNLGKAYHAQYGVTQARVGHSSPILEKSGFHKVGDYKFLVPRK